MVHLHYSNHKETIGIMKTTEATQYDKSKFSVESISDYFRIEGINNEGDEVIVFGGDSANEDDYDKDYMDNAFDLWTGEIDEDGRAVIDFS